jgi:molybdopterin synthase sulfur carrier subunit
MILRLHAFLMYVAGQREFSIKAPATVKELLEKLSAEYGEKFDKWIWSEEEDVKKLMMGTIIMVNGKHIAHLNGIDTALCDDDVVNIFPPVGGG